MIIPHGVTKSFGGRSFQFVHEVMRLRHLIPLVVFLEIRCGLKRLHISDGFLEKIL